MTGALTTSQLAERTGVRAPTLRMWESRYRFPEPLPGAGRRRYRLREAERVLDVLRLRAGGLSLPAAIDRVRDRETRELPSIFAALRESRPELQPTVIAKRPLLAVTRAIEDEYCARAGGGTLYASFQRVAFYRAVERRWREIARAAQIAVVLADFPAIHRPLEGPAEVPIPREHPLAREWTLVIDAPEVKACIAAWERPAAVELTDALREFEVVWSAEPDVVSVAAEIARRFVATAAPGLAPSLPQAVVGSPSSSGGETRVAAALSHRIVGYLAAA